MGALVAITLAADLAGEEVLDSLVVAAPAVQLTSPLAPGNALSFLAPVVKRVLKKWDMPPVYADPELAEYDTNYPWAPMDAVTEVLAFSREARKRLGDIAVPTLVLQSRADTTVAPVSAEIVCDALATPSDQKRIVWFERTEHEMFRDCELDDTVLAVVDFVEQRRALLAATTERAGF